jgi:hypothetical protein
MGFSDLNKPKKTLGADNVNIASPISTFGQVMVESFFPIAQGDFVYGINDQNFTTSSLMGATVSSTNGICSLQSGTNASGSATVQLRRGLKYRPGQGASMKATALYDTPDAGNAQFIGVGNAENGYFIGYFGTSFGILHAEDGDREIRKLEITAGAGTEDVTITLDGNSIVVPVTGGTDVTQTAYQIALGDYSQLAPGGWLADAVSSSVYFVSARAAAAFDGSYSVSSGGSIVGSFSQIQDSTAQTTTFITASSFNIDRLDGKGPSGMTIDLTKGNVYEIQYQYLGFGNASFSVENPETGVLAPFHMIKNANARTTPVLKNPNTSVLVTSANIGGTTGKTLKTASMAGFVEGQIQKLDPKFGKSFTFPTVNSATYKPVALLKVNRVYRDQSCYGEFDLLEIGASNESAAASPKTLVVGLFKKAKISGDVSFEYVDENNSVVSYAQLSPSTNAISNLADIDPFYTFIVGAGQGVQKDITELQFAFGLGQDILIAVKTTGNVAGQVLVNWFEQQ